MRSRATPLVFSVKQLQLCVGAVACVLPPLLWGLGVLVGVGAPWPWPIESISDYHGTNLRVIFVSALAAIGILMLCYRGYERTTEKMWSDNALANFAGTAALIVAAVPNDADVMSLGNELRYPLATYVHFAAAGSVFVSMFWFSAFRFTMSDHTRSAHQSPQKRRRNAVYRLCAALIATSMVCLLAGFIFDWWLSIPTGIFWFESLGMVAFGFAWLTKSQVLPGLGD
ncbi:MAG: hypothetical protein JNL19_06080 [Burkholderiales bacterium]|nr:hypothetical protein [Burkholderiales bacterium]